jgi:hypothetical protein
MPSRRGLRAGLRIGGLLAAAIAAAAPLPASAVDAGGARILYYEPLQPAPNDVSRKLHSGELDTLSFDAYGRRFELSLGSNDALAAAVQSKTGAAPSIRLYRGVVADMPNSWVRLAVSQGEMRGMMWDGTQLLIIESARDVADALAQPLDKAASGTIVFRLADVLVDAGSASCATDDTNASVKGTDGYTELLQELKRAPAVMQAIGASRRLQVSALGDSLLMQRYGGAAEARDAILTRLNNVDGIFSSQLGVEIQVPSVNVNSELSDPLSDTTSSGSLLQELGELRRRSPGLKSTGLTHLFTGRDLDGTTVGIAYLSSLCDAKLGVGLTEVNTRGSWIESLIAAHEIGHNFGAVHDGEANKQCASTPQGQYLMSPAVNGSDRFSQCSLDLIRPNISTAACITALPPADISVPADLGTRRAAVGRPIEWELVVTNAGGSTATSVRADILVPPVVAIDDAFVVGGSCTSGAGVIQCQLGDVAGSTSRTVHLTLSSTVTGSSSISARVQAGVDSQAGNNSGNGTLEFGPEADLAVTVAGPASAAVNDRFTLNVGVTNHASFGATGVRVTVAVPASTSVISATLGGADCAVNASSIVCTIPHLAAGGSATGVLSVQAVATGDASFQAQVAGDYVDPDAANDSATATVSVTTTSPAPQASSASSSGGGGGSAGPFLLLGLIGLLGARRRLSDSTH